jgi:hypothetical protein
MNDEPLKQQLEASLVQPGNTVESINCVIRAIYQLSYNYYLKHNGFSLHDLDEASQLGHFRQLQTWPSESKFVFSLQQMRDAYALVAESPLASQLMSQQQIESARKRHKPKSEFWTLLGEAPSADQSYFALEQDSKTSAAELQRLRLLAHAFRIVLFQNKITQFKETGNFLFLLSSANRQMAKEAFQNCVGLLPFPAEFLEEEAGEEGEGEEGQEAEEGEEKRVVKAVEERERESRRYESIVATVVEVVEQLLVTKRQMTALAQQIQQASDAQLAFCAQFKRLSGSSSGSSDSGSSSSRSSNVVAASSAPPPPPTSSSLLNLI